MRLDCYKRLYMRTLVLLAIFITFGIVIFLLRKYTGKGAKKRVERQESDTKAEALSEEEAKVRSEELVAEGECCGAHEICEKTGRYNPKFQADYYDDEELDEFKGMNPEDYTDEQIAIFDEILMTMKESDVPGWLKSLQIREIELPYSVRDKAMIILG